MRDNGLEKENTPYCLGNILQLNNSQIPIKARGFALQAYSVVNSMVQKVEDSFLLSLVKVLHPR